ncbi:MAG: hypothetical protein LBH96_03560 [Candidatus Peribacteria bacterium]|nr:hypothetical protein [Candidatus Peribacteria bacterium]
MSLKTSVGIMVRDGSCGDLIILFFVVIAIASSGFDVVKKRYPVLIATRIKILMIRIHVLFMGILYIKPYYTIAKTFRNINSLCYIYGLSSIKMTVIKKSEGMGFEPTLHRV